MTTEMMALVSDLRARQLAGEHMPCPRCGYDNMNDDIREHAKSRHADIYICDDCISSEAGLDVMNVGNQMLMWKCFEFGIHDEDPNNLTVKEIQERIENGQIEHLLDFCEKIDGIKDDAERWWARLETMRKCPGIYELWIDSMQALYTARDGDVTVRFRRRDGKIEYAVNTRQK